MATTKILQSKTIPAGIPDYSGDGRPSVEHELYRYIDPQDERDARNACWYTTIEHAERSWSRRHPAA